MKTVYRSFSRGCFSCFVCLSPPAIATPTGRQLTRARLPSPDGAADTDTTADTGGDAGAGPDGGDPPGTCPGDPGTAPDDNGYCASESQDIAAGDALVLELDDAELSNPRRCPGCRGRASPLRRSRRTSLDPPPTGSHETLVSAIYALDFTDAQMMDKRMVFSFDVATDATTGLYARIKVVGGIATEGQGDSRWLIVFGELDEETVAIHDRARGVG